MHLRDEGARHDVIAAVFAPAADDDLVRLLARVDALADFLGTEDGANLLIAYRRAANILRIEERKDGPHEAYGRSRPLLRPEAQETALWPQALDAAAPDDRAPACDAEDFRRRDGGAGRAPRVRSTHFSTR